MSPSEPECACSHYDDKVALVGVEAVEHVVAECHVFGENGFVVGYAVGQRVHVLGRHGNEVAKQTVRVHAQHLDATYAVFGVLDEGTDYHAGAHFEPRVVVVLGHIGNGGVTGHGDGGFDAVLCGSEVGKIRGRYRHFRDFEFDFAFGACIPIPVDNSTICAFLQPKTAVGRPTARSAPFRCCPKFPTRRALSKGLAECKRACRATRPTPPSTSD